ncbi:hypothetical protein C8R46DRAFT_1245454 [Mycena filopes]|nr:hypothetical protein C8R46DRAFT_1245454 [Mycena filopes]
MFHPSLRFNFLSRASSWFQDFHASTIRLRGETPPISIGLTLERERPTDRGLDAKNRANILKSNELQFLVKRSVILSLACERRLVSISTSRPILRPALEVQEYVARVKGRVNILRGLIRATDPGGASRVESFAKACRMPETSSAHAMVEEVERVVRRAHRRRVLLAQEQHLLLPLGDTVNISPIDTYQRTAEETHARAKLLLTRKGTKADSGRALATEVRQLLGEVKKVVGIAGKE